MYFFTTLLQPSSFKIVKTDAINVMSAMANMLLEQVVLWKLSIGP